MGIGESIKGTLKEKAGDLVDNDELTAEGEAQQTKGDEETRESKDRAEAKAHEEKADALEQQQEALED
ncbi:MAG: CsbD family protein [Jatrophihabitans sp.]|uniref:CsbD family protein n=1 Tax=Jatrophihabitans sp. TaxID=1932789 RepID=UPI003910138F